MPNALQLSLVHLTGDYPVTDYSTWARPIHFLNLFVSGAFVGVPAGLVVAIMSKELKAARLCKHEEAPNNAARIIQLWWRNRRLLKYAKKIGHDGRLEAFRHGMAFTEPNYRGNLELEVQMDSTYS